MAGSFFFFGSCPTPWLPSIPTPGRPGALGSGENGNYKDGAKCGIIIYSGKTEYQPKRIFI